MSDGGLRHDPVVEPNHSAELFLEAPILLPQVLDRSLLMLVDPPCEDAAQVVPGCN